MLRFGAVFDRFGAVFDRLGAENHARTIENGAETKHLNSTRTARPPKGPGSSSRIQMLKSSWTSFEAATVCSAAADENSVLEP